MADAALPPPPEQKIRVVVVDDDAVDRLAVRRALEHGVLPVDVVESDGGDDTLQFLTTGSFDCAFLDYNLPRASGLTLLRRLREAGLAMPVIMLTGQGDEEVAVELMKAGAADYIAKGVLTNERLNQSLRYAVELARAAAATRAAQEETRNAAEATRFLAEASRAMADSLDVLQTMRTVAELSIPRLGDFCAVLARIDGHRQVVTTGDAGCEPSTLLDEIDREVRSPSGQQSTRVRQLADQAAIVIPLRASDVCIGAILFARGKERAYAPRDIALAEDLAQRAATAMDNAQLFLMVSQARQRAEEAAGRTQRLQELTAALAASATEREVGDIVMQYGVLPTGAYAGVIAERIDADTLELRTSVGYPPTACMVVGRRWPVDASIPLAEAARTGEAVFVGSPDEWASRYPRGYSPAASAPVVPSSQSQAWAAFPLHTEHGGRGAILWAFATPREFSDEDRRFMETVAQQGAQALERARLREAERRARAEAEDANRAKSEFLARMSHDLRTPLNAIGGYAQLIEEGVYGDPTEGQRQSLARIRRAQQHLLTLINDVLSFAKLEAGQVRVKATPVAMADIITSLRSLIDPVASAKGLAFKVADGPPDIVLRTDADRVIQIVGNLLTNATKFTDAGGTITLGWTVAGDRASITVTDTGQGIAPDRVTTIFEPFVQLEGPAHENRQGVGLGLAIGRELARMLNGDLNVESTLGQGSTFTLRLPLETSRVLVGAEAG